MLRGAATVFTFLLLVILGRQLWVRPDTRWVPLQFALFSSLVFELKSIVALQALGMPNYIGPGEYLLLLAIAAGLHALLQCLFGGWTPAAVTTLHFSVSILFWLDIVYFRFFQDVLSASLWRGAGQMQHSIDSVLGATRLQDGLLILDIPIWLLLCSRLQLTRFRRSLTALAPLWMATVIGIAGFFLFLTEGKKLILSFRFQNRMIVSQMGLLNYHAYDLWWASQAPSMRRGDWEADTEKIDSAVREAASTVSADSEFKGLLRGRNVIVVQLESLQWFASEIKLGDEYVMPFTHSLSERSLVLKMMDQSHHGRSSDGEFCMLQGVHPPPFQPVCFSFPGNDYGGLIKTLEAAGYTSFYAMPYQGDFWNARRMATVYGFDNLLFADELGPVSNSERLGWGMRDAVFFDRALEQVKTATKPFVSYWATVGSHHPFDEVPLEERDFSDFPSGLSELGRGYLECCRLRDKAVQELVRFIEEWDAAENTVLVLVGDHDAALPETDLKALGLGSKASEDYIKAIIYAPGVEWPAHPTNPLVGQIDLYPTLLHLLGQDSLYPHLGWNVLSCSRPFVVSRSGNLATAEQQSDEEKQASQELRVSQGLLELNLLGKKSEP